MAKRRDYMVTVCDRCMKASCWHGLFYCDDAQTSGTKDLPASELRKLRKEHRSYFALTELQRVCGDVRYIQEAV